MNIEFDAYKQKLGEIAQDIPVIMINGFVDAQGIYSVCSEDAEAVTKVTDLLCQRQLSNCVLLYDSMTQGTKRKIAGFQKGLAQNGIEPDDRKLVFAGETLQSSMETVEKLITEGNIPDAVIATSDVLAAGAIQAFNKHHLPRSVIGFDNTILCECLVPSLTSIDLHMEKACDIAMQILDRLLEKKPCQQLHSCPAEIVWRDSFFRPDL